MTHCLSRAAWRLSLIVHPSSLSSFLGLLLVACPFFVSAGAAEPILLHDVTRETGITFRHTDGGSGRHYIVQTLASGVATFDYDGDGWIDIYFLNGRPLRGTRSDSAPRNALYRNVGGFRFEDVTDEAGVGDLGYGLGVCAGDFDNDGWPDLYVNNYGPNVFYHNNGDGTFRDVTEAAGVGRGGAIPSARVPIFLISTTTVYWISLSRIISASLTKTTSPRSFAAPSGTRAPAIFLLSRTACSAIEATARLPT